MSMELNNTCHGKHGIPKIIIQVTKRYQPSYITDFMKIRFPDWVYINFTDAEIYQYFEEYPHHEFKNIKNVFDNIRKGEHRSDLFRYYYLYINGGVYVDGDLNVEGDLDDILRNGTKKFVSVHAYPINSKMIFNGFIGCTPKHPILHKALKKSI